GSRKRSSTVAERSDDINFPAERPLSSGDEGTEARVDHSTTGNSVVAVLNAGEAAGTIREDARRQADEILSQAKVEAHARVDELTREAERARAEADDYARDIGVAVDSYGTQARRGAEEDARNL